MEGLLHKLKLGSSAVAIIASAQIISGSAAQAQTAATPSDIETVVVTGTSIRGVEPVGSNLISVTAQDISQQGAQTVQEVLANMPALSNFGNAGDGTFHVAGYGPAIHNLGGSASSATLVIFDGHRAPNFGGGHLTVDPNIIPTDMIEKVEVIPNGNSSIYGSDAVSGVINFVTRTKFDGLQLNVNGQEINGASNEGASMLVGKSWDTGSAIFSYQFVNQGKLLYKDRSGLPYDQTQNAIAAGLPVATSSSATNFKTFTNCTDALVRINGAGNYFDAVTGQQYPTTTANAPCDPSGETAIVGHAERNNAMMKFRQDIFPDLSFGVDMLYSTLKTDSPSSVGTIGPVTVFATGAQANPYFQVPASYTGPAPASETVSINLDNILGGPAAYSEAYTTNAYVNATLEYKVPGSDWAVDWLTLVGQNQTHTFTNGSAAPGTGTANTSAVNLALNGTTNTSGNLTTTSIPNTTIIQQVLPITTATALDVWQVGAANRTTAAAKLAILQIKR